MNISVNNYICAPKNTINIVATIRLTIYILTSPSYLAGIEPATLRTEASTP